MKAKRKGGWIQTFPSGRKFWPLDPRPEDIYLEDIAHALSMKCRFGGHCREFYSVAQHAVLVARYLRRLGEPLQVVMWGLHHDDAEAYLPDICRPIKSSFSGFDLMESAILDAVRDRFGLGPYPGDAVKAADNVLLATEANNFVVKKHLGDWDLVHADDVSMLGWPPCVAMDSFLAAYREYSQSISIHRRLFSK